MRINDEIAKED
jgi:hypothetical protein